MRNVIVIACIAALLFAVVVIAPIVVATLPAEPTAVPLRCEEPRVDLQLVALCAGLPTRAPPPMKPRL